MSHIENMHKMLETLTECAKCELDKGIEQIDTKEFGEVADAIKDLCEASYYCSVKEAMEEYGEEDDGRMYYNGHRGKNGRYISRGRGMRRGYSEPDKHMMEDYPMTVEDYHGKSLQEMRDMDRSRGRMYYTDGSMPSGTHSSSGNSNVGRMGSESRYDRAKRNYTESKEMHRDNSPESKQAKMRDLEAYLAELSGDLSEMIRDMTPEEKSMAKNKISVLATKM